jgi:hypothetical protein
MKRKTRLDDLAYGVFVCDRINAPRLNELVNRACVPKSEDDDNVLKAPSLFQLREFSSGPR